MKLITTLGLLIVVITCSCIQPSSNKAQPGDADANKFKGPESGLLIENSVNRGTNYTDPEGKEYSLRYIPITITNDSTISLHVQLAFSKQYHYPPPDSDQVFKLIPLPEEWALEGVDISESMIDQLPGYIENPSLSKTITPGEKLVLAIGTLYPRPAQTTGVLPRTLFAHSDPEIFPDCDWLMEKNRSSNQPIPMGLKIIFGEKCTIIPCGKVSYEEI